MSDGVGCFFEQERVELQVAAKNYDSVFCCACPHNVDCKPLGAQYNNDTAEGKNNES
ncbi:hypothetical protein KAR91_83355 [Candidatus Pacearchaeota archaeon]|nr:hypothetical protein [Candidatus Pacearchaeota archaeon]